MDVFLSIFFFLFGLALGSFTNVLIWRIPNNLSIVYPPSHCPNCKEKIKPYDNIPLFSYVLLKGKCRYCKSPISPRYPIVELLLGVLVLITFKRFGTNFYALILAFTLPALVALFWIDWVYLRLPDKLTLFVLMMGILASFMKGKTLDSILGALTGGILGLSIYYFSLLLFKREGFGWGDVKFLVSLGAWIGPIKIPFLIFLASLIGIILGTPYLIKTRNFRTPLPFGSFLSLAIFLMLYL